MQNSSWKTIRKESFIAYSHFLTFDYETSRKLSILRSLDYCRIIEDNSLERRILQWSAFKKIFLYSLFFPSFLVSYLSSYRNLVRFSFRNKDSDELNRRWEFPCLAPHLVVHLSLFRSFSVLDRSHQGFVRFQITFRIVRSVFVFCDSG